MAQPRPMRIVDDGRTANSLHKRYEKRPAAPEPENLTALAGFLVQELAGLKQETVPLDELAHLHEDVKRALELVRIARHRLDRIELGLLRAGKRLDMPARELGEPLGLTSRAGPGDRMESLARKVKAATQGVRPSEVDTAGETTPVRAPVELRDAARALLPHIHLWEQQDNVWAEGIEQILKAKKKTLHDDGSIRTQLRLLIADIDSVLNERPRGQLSVPAGARQALSDAREAAAR